MPSKYSHVKLKSEKMKYPKVKGKELALNIFKRCNFILQSHLYGLHCGTIHCLCAEQLKGFEDPPFQVEEDYSIYYINTA
jgi:hypothetical protein